VKPQLKDNVGDRGHEPRQKQVPERANPVPGLVLLANLRPNQGHGMIEVGVAAAARAADSLEVMVGPVSDN
jgi:hypothetical protein